jgi:hypothetical protein
MTSQINPSSIDINYPVAGQPNNTQGFRDNFAAIQNNFTYAETEIDDLQSKAVLKAALTGGTLDNNMNDVLLYAARIQDFSATSVNIATTTGAIAVDYSAGHYQRITTTGNINISFTNFPGSGSLGVIRLQLIIDNAARTATITAPALLGTTGIQGYVGGTITFAAAGTYEFEFSTSDSGATVTVFDLNRPLNAYTNGVTSNSGTAGIGYATGAGGAVAQGTSRTTGVTLNKVAGAITLYSAAGSASYQTFTVTNSTVAATDVIIVNQKSGSDKYEVFVTNVSNGSFNLTYATTGGTTVEQPVFNFAVIKAVAA